MGPASGGGWDDMVRVGRIARPHGNRGEVIVDPETDFPDERFAVGSTVFVAPEGIPSPLTVAEFRMHAGRPVIRFDGTTSISEADALRGFEMRVPEDTLAELPEGMWYHHELLGSRVRTADGREVGRVVSIQGPTDRSILEIEGPEGRALVPLVAEYCRVDRDAKIIEIDPPEGLLELNRGGWRERAARGEGPPQASEPGGVQGAPPRKKWREREADGDES